MGQGSPWKVAFIKGKDMPGHVRRHSAVSCAKMAEPLNLPFGLCTRVGQRKYKFNHICQVALMCPHGRDGREYWCHLANTIQGDHSSWKVMEFSKTIFQAWKVMENSQRHGKSWKMMMMYWNFL